MSPVAAAPSAADAVAESYESILKEVGKDHSVTAYHHDDDIWVDDVGDKLKKIASFRPGRLPKDHLAAVVDARDKISPDNWVPRNPDLIRLTGKHPLNAEPPVPDLYDQGFITPVSMHYVRSHGKVPKIEWDEHTLHVGGLVDKPMTFTMDDLLSLPKTTIPVTIVCSGNRRKENNMIKQTVGFNWTCGAHSCNLWTGVKMSDLLAKCGVDMEKARYVIMEGAKREGLPNGLYGTHLDILTATNPYEFVLVAWEQNGIPLAPDHGFPLRIVCPGFVGGRSVKYVERLTVSDKPSDNFYHFHDNRIMPSHVTPELAQAEGWWFKEQYIYNHLNVNSVIVYPSQGETMYFNESGKYTVKGFANSGGGRKVTRVEISLDGGKTWDLTEVSYPEERYSIAPKYGKYWAWMFWEYTLDKSQLTAKGHEGAGVELRSRAWDCDSNTQPSEFTWNMLGMGNNCHYRVKAEVVEEFGLRYISFKHPVAEAASLDGWMKLKEPISRKGSTRGKIKKIVLDKTFTAEEVEEHNSEDSAWVIIDDRVYDATPYLEDHPGGAESIIMNAGADATEDFMAIHSDKAKRLLENYYIGELAKDGGGAGEKKAEVAAPTADAVALNPKKWQEFPLVEKVNVSHDTRLYKFKLADPNQRLGLPCGYHMFVQAKVDGAPVMRAYTPVSSDKELGFFKLCIKVYKSGVHPKFPAGGVMSQHMDSLKIGDTLRVKGPVGHFEYKGNGVVSMKGKDKKYAKIGLIAGGTGLTPAFQVMQAVYRDASDNTEVSLVYANRTPDDILMRETLDKMAAERENIKVWYTVSGKAPEGWSYSTGYVNEEMLADHLPSAGDSTIIGMCGPPGLIEQACLPNLDKLGHDASRQVQF